MLLPVGLVYDPVGMVILDPDAGVQHAVRHLFTTARTGSARASVQAFRDEGLSFPSRVRSGPHKGESPPNETGCRLQDVVGPAQFQALLAQLNQLLVLGRGGSGLPPGVDVGLLDSQAEGLGATPNWRATGR